MIDWRQLFRRSFLPRLIYGLRRIPLRIARPTRLGVRTLVFDPDDRVLLIRHSYRGGWHLPGGGVRRWETAADAAVRETHEETGVEITRLGPLIGLYANFQIGYSDHVALFAAQEWRPGTADSLEITDMDFFPLDTLPDGTSPPTGRRLAEWQGAAPSGRYW